MLLPPASTARALLCLCLCLNLATAQRFAPAPARRDDLSSASTGVSAATSVEKATSTSSPTASQHVESASTTLTTTSSASSVKTNGTSTATSVTSASTATTTSSLNSTFFNTTIPYGELPLTPQLTPGFAVAGVVLMLTGMVHTLIGIRTRYVHSFFSAGYLASLGTTVLILYVMPTPVANNGVQGGYVAAIACTGLVLGAVAVVFKETTEALGCLLGGFCLAMWVLTLREGGTIPGTAGKVALIAALSLACSATYFARRTRYYALMACIAFSGATAVVLGIDCYSRAGLKEFWAYIWAVNGDLFPSGADTYPITKGIIVELVATVLVFVAGMVSQLRLWRVIRDRRARREEMAEEVRRVHEVEERQVGRQVEFLNSRERRRWERVYGDGEGDGRWMDTGSSGADASETRSKKGTAVTTVTTVMTREESEAATPSPAETEADAEHPMVEIPLDADADADAVREKGVLSRDSVDGKVTVRVAQDEGETAPAEEKKVWIVGSDGEARLQTEKSRSSRSFPPPPEVVPLPFTVPSVHEGEEEEAEQDRSSSAGAYVDEDAGARDSLANRLSVGSANLLRSLSQRSRGKAAGSDGESGDELVFSRRSRRFDDDADSLAANLDDLSSDDGRDGSDDEEPERVIDMQVAPDRHSAVDKRRSEERSTRRWFSPTRAGTEGETVSTPPPSLAEGEPSSPTEKAAAAETETRETADGGPADKPETASQQASSRVPEEPSPPAALKPEHLPRTLSRVAVSYRTNEWAKHLSRAEAPEPEDLRLNPYFADAPHDAVEEAAAALDVEELQKTADNAPRPAAAPRSASMMSMSRNSSRTSLQPTEPKTPSPTSPSFPPPAQKGTKFGRRSGHILVQPIPEEGLEGDLADQPSPSSSEDNTNQPYTSSSPVMPEPLPSASVASLHSRPPVPGVVSHSSPQTPVGRRDMLLRSRSQLSFYGATAATPAAPAPEPAMPAKHMDLTTIHALAPGDLYNHPTPGPGDDLPLSQRRTILRQSGLSPQPRRSSQSSAAQHPQAQLAPVFRTTTAAQAGRSLDQQRAVLLELKEAEARAREAERIARMRGKREFEDRMHRGELLGAHREAMRRLQGGAS